MTCLRRRKTNLENIKTKFVRPQPRVRRFELWYCPSYHEMKFNQVAVIPGKRFFYTTECGIMIGYN